MPAEAPTRYPAHPDPVPAPAAPDDARGLVDGYRLVARLGTGGMADVFAADAPGGPRVVVKILRASPDAPDSCRREFRLTRAAGADVTTTALLHGLSDRGPYLVTRYLTRHRCATELADEVLPPDRLWALAWGLSTALADIHARGVVHCDVKPSNLLVHAQDVRLIDFGIARYVDEDHRTEGTVRCSPGWAAPEQRAGGRVTPAVDVFAWGCVLSHLATGLPTPAALAALIRAARSPDPLDRPGADRLAGLCADATTRSH